MITCKIGNSIVNCYDNKYNRTQLKEWSDKDILKCPACDGVYEYCHGMVVSQYFRHKNKSLECQGLYSEPETEEHIKGKLLIYKWLQELESKNIISNVKLESYIRETKQRPDLYFEQDGSRYVIEFQCTPIATEYLKRRELYKLADVKDIWVLGLDKYHIHGEGKTIEVGGTQLKLDVEKELVHTDGALIRNSLDHGVIGFRESREFLLKDLTFDKNTITLSEKKLRPYKKRDDDKYAKMIVEAEKQAAIDEANKDTVKKAREIFNNLKVHNKSERNRMDVRFLSSGKKRYCCRIEVFHNGDRGKHLYFFFGDDSVACSKRIMINKMTGNSYFVDKGKCDYNGNDFSGIENFIKEKTDELSEEGLIEVNK